MIGLLTNLKLKRVFIHILHRRSTMNPKRLQKSDAIHFGAKERRAIGKKVAFINFRYINKLAS